MPQHTYHLRDIEKIVSELNKELQRPVLVEEIAKKLNVSRTNIAQHLDNSKTIKSTYTFFEINNKIRKRMAYYC